MKYRGLVFVVLIGFVLCSLSIYYFVGVKNSWNFNTTGTTGDAIGGLTGPIINFISAVLVYMSFKEQLTANQIQKLGLEEEIKRTRNIRAINTINDTINVIDLRIKNFEYNYSKGKMAFEKLPKTTFDELPLYIIEEFYIIILCCMSIIKRITIENLSEEERILIFLKLNNVLTNYNLQKINETIVELKIKFMRTNSESQKEVFKFFSEKIPLVFIFYKINIQILSKEDN